MASLNRKSSVAVALLLATAASGSACAMAMHAGKSPRCAVQGEERLPPELGGAQGVCATIQRATATALKGAGIAPEGVSITVHVRSEHVLTASVTAGGMTLPEQNVATMDRPLNAGAVQMLADAIASELAKSGRT